MKAIFLLCLIGLIGCERRAPHRYQESDFQVIVIDGCQYLGLTSNNSYGNMVSVTHKGNCNNPIHGAQAR
jgi:hypothetical protein